MSKETVFGFLAKAAEDDELKDKLQTVSTPDELADLGKEAGFEFEPEHVEQAVTTLQQAPGFFSVLADAIVQIFSPSHDDYPSIGVQPFTGDPSRK